jgi:hypothetical protein
MNTTIDRVQTALSSTQVRILKLLGSGHGPEVVSNACGVTVSYVSQLLSEPEFAAQVSELRFANLQKYNELDEQYDTMEQQLVKQLSDILPLIMRPMELIKAISVINAVKRRGQSAPEQVTNQTTIVNLQMPVQIIQKFTTNSNNQVINAGNQTLETMQSNTLLNSAKQRASDRLLEGVRNDDVSRRTA